MNHKLAGTGVALVTPFTMNSEIDYPALERLLTHVTQGGVNYLVVMGTTGESPTVTADEKKQVLQFVKQFNRGRLPIVYGVGGNHTEEVRQAIRQTDFEGIDAILSVSPYYNKPTQRGIYQHYTVIADAAPVPIILYNVPGRTQSNIEAATTLELARHPNIIGIKEAAGDLLQAAHIASRKPDDFLLLAGDDLLTVPTAAIGAVGVISVLANAFPGSFGRMVNEALAGNFTAASRILFGFLEINALLYAEGNPVGIKQALQELGICGNTVRLPLAAASDALAQKIRKAMETMADVRPAAVR